MTASEIETERLRLVAMTPEMLRADAAGRGELAEVLQVDVPGSWPPENWEPHVFAFLEKQHRETPHTDAWNRYVVLKSETPTLIGTMGGFPKGNDEAEIGYSLLASWHGMGLATEGMLAFLEEMFRDGAVRSISAQTYPTLAASMRVLEKCGFRRDAQGDEEGTIRYRLDMPGFGGL